MFLFIFLIFGQVFAADELDNVIACTEKASKILSYKNAQNVSLQYITDQCIRTLNARNVKVEEATVNGDTHKLKLSSVKKGGSRIHFFNVAGKPCVEPSKMKSFALNVDEIVSNTKNSTQANTCEGDQQTADQIYKQYETVNYGFGFQKVGGGCKRICGQNEILQGIRAPIVFTDGGMVQTDLSIPTKDGYTEQLADVRCIPCPKDSSIDKIDYTSTNRLDNSCYDVDGCKEGTIHIPGLKSLRGAGQVSIKDHKKYCFYKCEPYEERSPNGDCTPSSEKRCEHYKNVNKTLDSWLTRFNKTTQTAKMGNCDMENIRSIAKEWVARKKQQIANEINEGCDDQSFLYDDWIFKIYLGQIVDEKSLTGCLSLQNSKKFDPIYELDEDLMRKDSTETFLY